MTGTRIQLHVEEGLERQQKKRLKGLTGKPVSTYN